MPTASYWIQELHRVVDAWRTAGAADRSAHAFESGTPILSGWNLHLPAVNLSGRIDIYPEYTGTALTAILKAKSYRRSGEVYQQVKSEYESRFGLTLGPPFGFNNTFAMEIRGEDARRLNLKTLSQAASIRSAMARRFRLRVHGASRWLYRSGGIVRSALRRAAAHHGSRLARPRVERSSDRHGCRTMPPTA